jgi:CheY-like chemotaxis protein
VRQALSAGVVDCLVSDGSVSGLGTQDVIESIERQSFPCQLPLLLWGGDAATTAWDRANGAFAVHSVDSVEQLVDAAARCLHRPAGALSARERTAAAALEDAQDRAALQGRKVLIVDDDMRNIFALAAVLDARGMTVLPAENGRDAIRLVASDPSIDIVLMDIMMPDMDGIETMREMRRLPRGKELPLVAVTAKAMKGDREKCIAAGAWDYLSKPVDTAQLLVVLRGWLRR